MPYQVRPKRKSLWLRLKTEELETRDWTVFADLADTQASVADYFDYYNHQRRHSSIGYQKPYHYHQQQLTIITRFSTAQPDAKLRREMPHRT